MFLNFENDQKSDLSQERVKSMVTVYEDRICNLNRIFLDPKYIFFLEKNDFEILTFLIY